MTSRNFINESFITPGAGKEVEIILKTHFGDRNRLHTDGLICHYKELKNDVIKNNRIGLILHGLNSSENTVITNYITVDHNVIPLTVNGLCEYLINDFFSREEIECCILDKSSSLEQ